MIDKAQPNEPYLRLDGSKPPPYATLQININDKIVTDCREIVEIMA